ncbi:MAG: DUF4114 domain-containing protein [Rhodanobacteraceae bacterium]
MNTVKALGLVGLATAGLFAAQAFATTCPASSPTAGAGAMQGSPVCIAPYGSDGPGTGLANVLGIYNASTNPDGIIKPGGTAVNPYTQQAQQPYWSINSSGGSVANILLQIAGNAGTDTFGIFDPTDPSNKFAIFTDGANGQQTTLTVWLNGGYSLNGTPVQATFGVTNYFGYYLISGGQTFYSLPSLNETSSLYPDGTPHMVAYQGNGSDLVALNGHPGGLWDSSEYILAWEDLPFGDSDLDYNDFIVEVESVHPVPEPAVLGMFGLGLLAIAMAAGLRRRRANEA